MVFVQPGTLRRIKQRRVDQAAVERRQGQRFELQKTPLRVWEWRWLRQQQVLQPDAIVAGRVKTGLVRQNHTRRDGHGAGGARNARGSLMHREVQTHAMPRTMVVIESCRPERPAGDGIQMRSGNPLDEDCPGQSDMTLEHAG